MTIGSRASPATFVLRPLQVASARAIDSLSLRDDCQRQISLIRENTRQARKSRRPTLISQLCALVHRYAIRPGTLCRPSVTQVFRRHIEKVSALLKSADNPPVWIFQPILLLLVRPESCFPL